MSLINNILFFDYNSTTPVDSTVLDAMLPYLQYNFANPSSSHQFGLQINEKVKEARQQIADFLNADANELVFTSGATEAINLAIKGVAECNTNKGKHIITVSTEHKAVLDTCKDLEKKGFEITYLSVNKDGLLDLEELKQALRHDTILVSVMLVNNETGVIQPIAEIAEIVRGNGALMMTDATQAVGKLPVNVEQLGIDLLCFSGHKMYAPKGIGALYVRQSSRKSKIIAQMHGGGHEFGLRSGTLNVPGIIALAKACEIAESEMDTNKLQIKLLRDYLESEIIKLPGTFVNGHNTFRAYNTTNICFEGQDANMMIGRLKNIAVSNGSACSSSVIEPSHVLRAMNLNEDQAFGSIRFSLGKYNMMDEIHAVLKEIIKVIQPNNSYA
jgi:cysteine desulfurase